MTKTLHRIAAITAAIMLGVAAIADDPVQRAVEIRFNRTKITASA